MDWMIGKDVDDGHDPSMQDSTMQKSRPDPPLLLHGCTAGTGVDLQTGLK